MACIAALWYIRPFFSGVGGVVGKIYASSRSSVALCGHTVHRHNTNLCFERTNRHFGKRMSDPLVTLEYDLSAPMGAPSNKTPLLTCMQGDVPMLHL